jgi:hypothetical protein
VYKLFLNGTLKQRKWSRYRAAFSYSWPSDTPAGFCKVEVAVYYVDTRHKDGVILVTKNSTTVQVTRAKLTISSDGPTPPGGRTHFTFKVEDSVETLFMYNWTVNCFECKSALPIGSLTGTEYEDIEQSWSYDAETGQYSITTNVYSIGNDGCVFLDSASLNFQLTDEIITNIDVVYSDSRKSVCSGCCATPGEFAFHSTIHNPGGFYDTTSLIFDWHSNFPKVENSDGSDEKTDGHRKPKHDGYHKRETYQEGEDVLTQEVTTPGNYSYTVTVTGNSYERGDEHSGHSTGTICIQDPISNVLCEMPEVIKVLENTTLKLSCNGSYPVNFCISTCDKSNVGCTGYVNKAATMEIYFEKAGQCYINVTAANTVSSQSSEYSIFVSDIQTSSGASYTAPVVGTITATLVIIAVVVGIHQYKAYKSRNSELTFEYIDRPPAYNIANVWSGFKSTMQNMLHWPQQEEKQPLNPQQFQPPGPPVQQASQLPPSSNVPQSQEPNLAPQPYPSLPAYAPPPLQPYEPPAQIHNEQQQTSQPKKSPIQQHKLSQESSNTSSQNQQPTHQLESSEDRSREDSPARLMPWADNFVSFASFGTFTPNNQH